MPRLTRWSIRSGMLYLVAALLLGVALMVRDVRPMPAFVGVLGPAYLHLLVVGWVTQFIFGVAFWMFPRLSRGRPWGNVRLAWTTYATLNAGLLLRAVAEPANAVAPAATWGWLLTASATLQWLAALGFALNMWARVKER